MITLKSLFLLVSVVLCLTSASETETKENLQLSLEFNEIYTTSVHYTIKDSSSIDINFPCVFINTITSKAFECASVELICSCTSGTINRLKNNQLYYLSIKNNGVVVLQDKLFRTASPGVLSWTFGLHHIAYTMVYREGEIKPYFCSASVNKLESKIKATSDDECVSGIFKGLEQNTAYELTLINDEVVMHTLEIDTGYYIISTPNIGLEAFRFVSNTNMDFSASTCELFEKTNKSLLVCDGQNTTCDCHKSIVTNLSIDTNYSIEIRRKGEVLQEFSVLTASTANMAVTTFYSGLNYTVIFADADDTPSHCYPCFFDSVNNPKTVDQCRQEIKDKKVKEEFCRAYWYSNLPRENYYTTILFDAFGSIVGSFNRTLCPKSEIVHTSYELTSISYELDSQLSYDSSRPCYALTRNDKDASKRSCLVDGVKTTNCNCNAGKLVDLYQDSYNPVALYQDDKPLAVDLKMYTAGKGSIYLNTVGLYHFGYRIEYGYDYFPPYTCQACVSTDSALFDFDCPSVGSISGKSVCRTHKFTELQNSTHYFLKIVDGDNVKHTNANVFTSGLPVYSIFETENDLIRYQLSYFNTSWTPYICKFFFEEDLSTEADCADASCDCKTGSIIIPTPQNYTKLIIVDSNLEILAKYVVGGSTDSNGPTALSTGGIIGLCVFALVILVIIITTATLITLRRRTSSASVYNNF